MGESVNQIILGDSLDVLRTLADGSINLIYIDPPFNTGQRRTRTTLTTVRDEEGDRFGFGGQRYRTERGATLAYDDVHDDYLGFLVPRLRQAHRVLAQDGALYIHLDYREVHHVKVMLDGIFGRVNFLNEIIWAYDYGGRPKRRWAPKHDTILYYARDRRNYVFNAEAIDRVPYRAPDLVGPIKAARGKQITDTWWQTIVSPTGKEKTGYPTQKPLAILRRIIAVSSRVDDLVLDFFAGSGTTGVAAHEAGRRFILVDSNPAAVRVMARRFPPGVAQFVGYDPGAPEEEA